MSSEIPNRAAGVGPQSVSFKIDLSNLFSGNEIDYISFLLLPENSILDFI